MSEVVPALSEEPQEARVAGRERWWACGRRGLSVRASTLDHVTTSLREKWEPLRGLDWDNDMPQLPLGKSHLK